MVALLSLSVFVRSNVIPAKAGIQTFVTGMLGPPKRAGFRLALRLAGMTDVGAS
jgi:hypothetical protein